MKKNLIQLILIFILFAFMGNSFAQSAIDNIINSKKNEVDNVIYSQKAFTDDIIKSLKYPLENYTVKEMKVEELKQAYGDKYDINWAMVATKFGIGAGIIVITGTVGVIATATGAEPIAVIAFASAKGAAVGCVEGAMVGGGISALIEGLRNSSFSAAKKGMIEGAADGCMWGAAIGAVTGGYGAFKASKTTKSTPLKNKVKPQENNCITGANGRCRINSNYAGETFYFKEGSKLAHKYPKGVPFDKNGFPHFEGYAKKVAKFKDPLKLCGKNKTCFSECVKRGECLSFNSSRGGADFKMANKQVGYEYTPEGWTWHHVDQETIILIPQDLHDGVRHTGAVSEFWNGL